MMNHNCSGRIKYILRLSLRGSAGLSLLTSVDVNGWIFVTFIEAEVCFPNQHAVIKNEFDVLNFSFLLCFRTHCSVLFFWLVSSLLIRMHLGPFISFTLALVADTFSESIQICIYLV